MADARASAAGRQPAWRPARGVLSFLHVPGHAPGQVVCPAANSPWCSACVCCRVCSHRQHEILQGAGSYSSRHYHTRRGPRSLLQRWCHRPWVNEGTIYGPLYAMSFTACGCGADSGAACALWRSSVCRRGHECALWRKRDNYRGACSPAAAWRHSKHDTGTP